MLSHRLLGTGALSAALAVSTLTAGIALHGSGRAFALTNGSKTAGSRQHHDGRGHGRERRGRHGRGLRFGDTATPIKHVIIIIGENHTFDNVFATYRPPAGQRVMNLLSEGIVRADGQPGPNYARAIQNTASDTRVYQLNPTRTGPFKTLPQPNTTYIPSACDGQPQNAADLRFPSDLPPGPYQITRFVPYFDGHGEYSSAGTCEYNGAYVGDPIHRFYQMYQEVSEGAHDLFTWVHVTSGDADGAPPPSPFTDESTDQGGLDMGFYNMAQGDAPVLDFLARHYAMSDNYHQAVMGGTGANHIALGTGYAAFYQNSAGQPATPPAGEIENPNPLPGTNNYYTQDGYGAKGTTDGGSYSECADHSAPGVSAVWSYLDSLSYRVLDNCRPGTYYLLNNYNPGYQVSGALNTSTFTVPPQVHWPTIGGELSAHGISWGYFGEGYHGGAPTANYCGICDPMQYSAQIMTNPALRANVQHGLQDFRRDVASGRLPAISFLKPGDDDGHPGYSTLAAFEGFVEQAVSEVQDNPSLWRSTAIFVTFDEGGGYYDSGYIQPVSFFGDGTRVPLIAISPYARPGYISHSYTDHASILKFIERNWGLPPVSALGLDNLPDPITRGNPYMPVNRPAIGDLFDLFDFSHARADAARMRAVRLPRLARQRADVPVVAVSNWER